MRTTLNATHTYHRHWRTVLLGVLSYIPLLLTRPGDVSADTKTYLFLNPGELLSEASSLWSSSVGAGTVTHQYIGYLWPMGPFFWLTDQLNLPDWISQRIWWGSLIFLAGYGTLRCARALGLSPNYALIAAVIYGFSPYVLHYLARLSGILLPWVGLPWLLLCLVRARHTKNWKWPAISALIIGTIGTVNATALFFILIGLGLWLIADVLAGYARIRDVLVTYTQIALGSIAVSMWWIVSLAMQSAYGLPILRYTETYDTVAKASLPQELLRGLGYWFFYGDEYGGRWIGPSAPYMYNRVVIIAGFFLATIGLVSLVITRSAHRIHFGLLTLVGLMVSVGAAPLSDSSIYGTFFEKIVNNESGFALRSTPRALPLVLIGVALATGSALEAFSDRLTTMRNSTSQARSKVRVLQWVAISTVLVAIFINNFPWFTQQVMTDGITRDEKLPRYWLDAATAIDETKDPATGFARTYEFPASNFADYWWGGTIDPVLPGIISSEYISKEMVPQGSEATTDLLSAFEARLVDGRADLTVLGSLAAILSSNTVTWRADLAYDRHLTARPEYLAPALTQNPPGQPLFTGPIVATRDNVAIVDESWYGNTRTDSYPLLQVWQVPNARPLLTTSDPAATTMIVGSGESVINSLSARLLHPTDTFIYAGTQPYLPASLAARRPQRVIVTDTNRKAARQWSSIAQQVGRTEQEDEPDRTKKPTDQRLNPFTDDYRLPVNVEQMTTSRLVGDIERVQASSYGHPVVLTPEARPENAIDGDIRTSWVVGVRSSAVNEWIDIEYRRPITASSLTIDLSQRQPGNRQILRGRLDFSDKRNTIIQTVPIEFKDRDQLTIEFPSTTFSRLRLTIEDETLAGIVDYSTAPGIALGEIAISGVTSREYIVVPRIASTAQFANQNTHYLLTRQYADPSIPHRSDSEVNIQRAITTPRGGRFSLSGSAQLSGRASESVLSDVMNLQLAQSSGHVFGSATAISSFAVDGDVDTAWTTPFDEIIGSEITTSLSPTTPSRTLRMHVQNDQFHSVPTVVTVTDASGQENTYEVILNDNIASTELAADTKFPVQKVRIDNVDVQRFRNYFTRQLRDLPVAIQEIDLGDDNPRRVPLLAESCQDDLVFVNDVSIPVHLTAPKNLLDTTQNISVTACSEIELFPGENLIRTAKGLDVGIDINQLVLQSGSAATDSATYTPVAITSRSRTQLTATIEATSPQIVSFGQSINKGWKATLKTNQGTVDLGEPFVVQGYANGWMVPESGELVLEWTPQRFVSSAIVFSLLSAFALLMIALRRRPAAHVEPQVTHLSPVPRRFILPGVVILLVLSAGFVAAALSAALVMFARRWSMVTVSVAMSLVALVIVVNQTRYGYPPTLDWPLRFSNVTPLAWLAVSIASINALVRRN